MEDPPDGDGQSYPADFEVDRTVVEAALPGYGLNDALLSIPTVSIAAPMESLFGPDGIYTRVMKKGTNWERSASVELIYADGRRGFAANAGVRMQGAVSRLNHATPKHPLRLAFRGSYGSSKLDFSVFPDSKVHLFDHLVLRACSTDAWCMRNTVDYLWRNYDATYQRDQWMRDTQLAMGHPSPHGLYVNLFLNGLYWVSIIWPSGRATHLQQRIPEERRASMTLWLNSMVSCAGATARPGTSCSPWRTARQWSLTFTGGFRA